MLLHGYAQLHRDAHPPAGRTRATLLVELVTAAHLTMLAATELDAHETVLRKLVEFAAARPEDAVPVTTAVFGAQRYDWSGLKADSPLLGQLTRDVFEALGCASEYGKTHPRRRYLSLRLRHLKLSAAEVTIGRLFLKEWAGTEQELVAATRALSDELNPTEAALATVFDRHWSGSLDSLLDTVRALATERA